MHLEAAEAADLSEKRLFWICFVLMGYSSCLTNGLLPSMQSYSTLCYNYKTFHFTLTLSGITATLVALVVTAIYGYGYLGVWLRSLFCCGHDSPASVSRLVGSLASFFHDSGVTMYLFACRKNLTQRRGPSCPPQWPRLWAKSWPCP